MFKSLIIAAAFALMFFHRIPPSAIIVIVCLIFVPGLLHSKGPHSHDEMLSSDYYAQNGRVAQVHTGIKLSAALLSVFICTASASPLTCLIVLAVMSTYTLLAGKIPAHYYISVMSTPLLFIALSGIAITAEFSRLPLGYLDVPLGSFYIAITPQSQQTAILLFLRALAGVSALVMVGLTTKLPLIIGFMQRIHIPKIIIELMYLIYRYIFVVFSIYSTMNSACASRLGYSSYRRTARSMMLVGTNLLAMSFRLASDNFDAMESRCYDGNLSFYQEKERLKIAHLVIFALYIVILAALQIGKI